MDTVRRWHHRQTSFHLLISMGLRHIQYGISAEEVTVNPQNYRLSERVRRSSFAISIWLDAAPQQSSRMQSEIRPYARAISRKNAAGVH